MEVSVLLLLAVLGLQASSTATTTTTTTTNTTTIIKSLNAAPFNVYCYACASSEYNGCGNCFASVGLKTEYCLGRCTTKAYYTSNTTETSNVLLTVERECSTEQSMWFDGCKVESFENIELLACYSNCNTSYCNSQPAPIPTTPASINLNEVFVVPREEPSTTLAPVAYYNCYDCDTTTHDGCGKCFNDTGLSSKNCRGLCITKAFYDISGSDYILRTVQRTCTTDPNTQQPSECTSDDVTVTCYETCAANKCNSKEPLWPYGISTASPRINYAATCIAVLAFTALMSIYN